MLGIIKSTSFAVLLIIARIACWWSSATWWPWRWSHATIHSWRSCWLYLRCKRWRWWWLHVTISEWPWHDTLVGPWPRHHFSSTHALVCVHYTAASCLSISRRRSSTISHHSTRAHIPHGARHLCPQHVHGRHRSHGSLLTSHARLHHRSHVAAIHQIVASLWRLAMSSTHHCMSPLHQSSQKTTCMPSWELLIIQVNCKENKVFVFNMALA